MPTIPKQYRLKPETLADLEAIREFLRGQPTTTSDPSQADAIRYAARKVASELPKEPRLRTIRKNTGKSA